MEVFPMDPEDCFRIPGTETGIGIKIGIEEIGDGEIVEMIDIAKNLLGIRQSG